MSYGSVVMGTDDTSLFDCLFDSPGYYGTLLCSFVGAVIHSLYVLPAVVGIGAYTVCDVYYKDRTGKSVSECIVDYFRRDPVSC